MILKVVYFKDQNLNEDINDPLWKRFYSVVHNLETVLKLPRYHWLCLNRTLPTYPAYEPVLYPIDRSLQDIEKPLFSRALCGLMLILPSRGQR